MGGKGSGGQPGMGRKSLYLNDEIQKITVSLPATLVQYFSGIGDGNVSQGIVNETYTQFLSRPVIQKREEVKMTPELWINSKTGKHEIRGQVDDPELAAAAIQAGYCNTFRRGVGEVMKEIQEQLPNGFRVGYVNSEKEIPSNAINIGQVKVHHGDPAFPLYVIRR
jgi:hypothetical protein